MSDINHLFPALKRNLKLMFCLKKVWQTVLSNDNCIFTEVTSDGCKFPQFLQNDPSDITDYWMSHYHVDHTGLRVVVSEFHLVTYSTGWEDMGQVKLYANCSQTYDTSGEEYTILSMYNYIPPGGRYVSYACPLLLFEYN